MNENVRRIFDMLGVEPNEKFKLKTYTGIEQQGLYSIDSDLCMYKDNQYLNVDVLLINMLQGLMVIEKLPKEPKKKKLRDLTEEEYDKWNDNNCEKYDCNKCMFGKVSCQKYIDNCWIYHKDLYSNKFLDQEIEVMEKYDTSN